MCVSNQLVEQEKLYGDLSCAAWGTTSTIVAKRGKGVNLL
jgi:hypothetical protein